MKLLGIINMGFNIRDFSEFIKYWKNNWSSMRDFKKAYDSIRREVLAFSQALETP
jgi:hypothetical protein